MVTSPTVLGSAERLHGRACFTLDWRQRRGNGVVSRKIRNLSDIAAIEREGLSAFLPETSPLELIEATSERFPDNAAIRYLTNAGAPDTDVVLSYRDLVKRIRQAANLFHRLQRKRSVVRLKDPRTRRGRQRRPARRRFAIASKQARVPARADGALTDAQSLP